MKDQYIGDINDFHKFALLRALARAGGCPTRVLWMLTPADGRSDGGRLTYLQDPERFRILDPSLFDALASIVSAGRRSVRDLQLAGILDDVSFHHDILSDDAVARELYFAESLSLLGPNELVFFDPDNGFEVPSVRKGRRNSAKYLYWDEFARALGGERTVCVYQHFPRRPRAPFIADLLRRMESCAPGHVAFALRTFWVVFAICTTEVRAERLIQATREIAAVPGLGLSLAGTQMDDDARPALLETE